MAVSTEPLRAEQLDERVTILRPVSDPNDRGGRRTQFAEDGDVWAEVIALRGDEALVQGVQRGTQIWRVRMRYRDDVGVKDRLRWRGLEMNISVAAPSAARDALVITAESGRTG